MKRLTLLLAGLLTLSILTACGSNETKTTEKTNGGNETTEQKKDEEKEEKEDVKESEAEKDDDSGEAVSLDIMHFHTPETMGNSVESRAYHAMADEYMEEHSDVEWNVTTLQQADFHTKVMALAAANEMPDVYFTKGSWVQNFYDNDLMADITESIDTSLFRNGIFTPFIRNDSIYALPIQFTITSVVYYNEAMWKDIGYDTFPETWEDLEDAAAKFKDAGITTFAHGNKDKWPFESCIISALGDRFTGTDWTQSIILNDGKAKFTDDEFITTLEYSQGMADMFNPDFNAITNEQADNLYATGKAAATLEGAWTVSYFLANADEDVLENTRLTVLPSVPDQKGEKGTTSGGAGWGQSVSSKLSGKALEIAIGYNLKTTGVEVCQFMMDDSGFLGQCEVPVADRDSLPQISQLYLDFAADVSLVPIYDIQMDGAVIDVMNTKLQELLNGSATPEDVAAAIQAEQDKIS